MKRLIITSNADIEQAERAKRLDLYICQGNDNQWLKLGAEQNKGHSYRHSSGN